VVSQRHCKECNVGIGKFKRRCPECIIIRVRAKAKASYKYTPEMAARLKKWREANKDKCKVYAQKNYQQRYCEECNIEVGKNKHYCPECLSIKQEEQKKRHNLEQTEYRKQRYENRDKEEYNAYAREYQRGNKFRAYMREYQRSNRKKITEYQKDRYQNDEDYRDRILYNGKRYRERKKQNWYQLRLERIEKLKRYLEMNR
jgi:hypothetical protein